MIVIFPFKQSRPVKFMLPVVAALLLAACGSDPLDVDVSDIEVDIEVTRWESQLFEAHPDSLSAINERLLNQYGELYEAYISEMTQSGSAHDPMVHIHMSYFLQDESMREVYDEIMKQYPNMDDIKAEFESAFRYFKYYYPESVVPEVVTFHSGLNSGIYTTDSALGVGLDMYLGRDNEIVELLPQDIFPRYHKDKMDRDYLVLDAMNGWFRYHYYADISEVETDFLSQMIYYGKIVYFMGAIMPEKPDWIKMKYTQEQWQWCLDNEYNIWKEMVDQEVLYSSLPEDIVKWIPDGPFTPALPKDSPARVGVWMGYRIVEAYMNDQETLSADPAKAMMDLFANTNTKEILKSYNPEKN